MRKLVTLAAVLLVASALTAGAQQSPQTMEPAPQTPESAPVKGKPESVHDRASYAIGLNLGRTLKSNDVQANTDLLLQGIRDGFAGAPALLTDEEIQAAMQALQQEVMQAQQAKQKVQGEKNKAEGEAFLAKNKERAGVKTTASGLQYEVLKEGTGAAPKATDTVTVHYTGTLIDGTKFDSSVDRGQPATFVLNQVIGGWTEGVQLMKVGSKHKLYIPAALGYGERGAGGTIGPNATLIFDIELLSIGAPTPPPPAEGQQPTEPVEPPAEEQKPPGR
jgi:FKBP-type peptidyl-prolyl cis-trans isomerase FklB